MWKAMLWVLAVLGGVAGLALFSWGIKSLVLSLGDLASVLGVWLAVGFMVGRDRERMLIGILACYALLFVLVVAYSLSRSGTPNLLSIQEIVGLLVLAAAGAGVGLLVSRKN